MKYNLMGRSGIRISKIGLGTAALGIAPEVKDSQALIDSVLEEGINYFDTATSYGGPIRPQFYRDPAPPLELRKYSEEVLGECLKGHRDDIVLATKVEEEVGPGVNDGGPTGKWKWDGEPPNERGGGLSRLHIMKNVEISLRRLQTDHIDVLYAHHVDDTTPIEETLRAFDDLIKQGKVLYCGLGTFNGWRVADAVNKAERFNLNVPIAHQVGYNMMMRRAEEEAIPASLNFGLGLLCYAPLHGGLLAGAEAARNRPPGQQGPQRWRGGQGAGFSEAEMAAAEELDSLSKEWGIPSAQLALAWLLSRPGVNCALIGPESPKELKQNAPAADLELSEEQLQRLDAIGDVGRTRAFVGV